MKPNFSRRRANRSGAVLVTAVGVLLIMSILMTATVGYVAVNRQKTNSNYSHKQAYLTASTTLKSFVAQIEEDTATPGDGDSAAVLAQKAKIDAIKAIAAENGGKGRTRPVTYNGAAGTNFRMGTTTLTLAQDGGNPDSLVATAVTEYAGVTEKVAAHFSIESVKDPVKFTNTIETIGGDSMDPWDNISVIGDTAVLNNDGNKVYVLQNDTNPQGSFFMYGHLVPNTAQMKFTLSSSQTDPKRGTFVQLSGCYFGEIKAESSMPRADGYNYIYIGGVANFSRNSYVGKNATNAIDVITHKLSVDAGSTSDYNKYLLPLVNAGKIESWRANTMLQSANSYEQYGNIYVYKAGSDAELNGDAIFNADSNTIHGDLYVEGDLYCNKNVTVDGNVYVGGSIKGSGTLSCSGTKKTGVSIVKDSRGAIPEMKANSNDYINMPEDLVKNSDPDIQNSLKSQFAALHSASAKKLDDPSFRKDYETSDGHGGTAKFRFYINENFVWNNVNSNSEFMNGNGNILINVTNKDIVVLMDKSLESGMDQQFQFVVKNDSPIETQKDGTKCHKYNCYFVSDMDQNGNLAFTGRNAAGVSQHTGSTPMNIELRSLRVYDFDTYVNMFPSSYYNNYKLNNIVGQKPKDSFVFNSSGFDSVSVTGKEVYTTKPASIYFFIGENSHITFSNNTLIQAIIYAPQAYFTMKTQGIGGFTSCDSAGYTGSSNNIGVMGIGVFIARRFQSENAGYYIYTVPAATSVLVGAKSGKENTLNGFTLDRYDHY